MIYRLGDRTIDTDNYEVRDRNGAVAVEPQVFDLLSLLIENRDRVVTKDEIFDTIWKGRVVSDSTLASRIKAARRAVGDDGAAQRCIKTVHGRGFRFVGAVVTDGPGETPANTAAPARQRPVVAVLPLANLSGDHAQAYLSDGITEDLIIDLSRFRTLTVTARQSSFSYRESSVPVSEVADRLQADYVLQGSVRRAGERIRVTAQLIDGRTERRVWAERYDRRFDDLFDVQDALTRAIVTTLSRRLETQALEHAHRKPPGNMDAYDHVLRGRERLERRDRIGVRDARRHFERATVLDPEYAQAWAELAGAHLFEWNGAWSESPEASKRMALQCAGKAVALDPNDARTIMRLAFNLLFEGQPMRALGLFERALSLNPNDLDILNRYGLVLAHAGRPREAIEVLDRARKLDPLGMSSNDEYLGIAYFSAHRYDKAIEVLEASRGGNAEVRAWLAAAYAQADMPEKAQQQGRRYLEAARDEMKHNRATPPRSWLAFLAERAPFIEPKDMQHFIDGLERAGLN